MIRSGKNNKKAKKGETLVEVLASVAIFGFVSVLTVGLMSSTLASSQGVLERTVVRNEIDAQAEAIRYVYDSYNNERRADNISQGKYSLIWGAIIDGAYTSESSLPKWPVEKCEDAYSNTAGNYYVGKKKILNTRLLAADDGHSTFGGILDILRDDRIMLSSFLSSDRFVPATVYSRNVYYANDVSVVDADEMVSDKDFTRLKKAEGIWFYAAKGDHYYDFYIQACWNEPGKDKPATLDTVIRLYNP